MAISYEDFSPIYRLEAYTHTLPRLLIVRNNSDKDFVFYLLAFLRYLTGLVGNKLLISNDLI